MFVINVAGPGAPRRAHIRSTFDAAQLNYVFLPATRCSLKCALWHTYMHPMRGMMDPKKMNQKAISAGNVALASSHNSMYKRLLQTQGAPYILVAEDDATVKPSFKKWLVPMFGLFQTTSMCCVWSTLLTTLRYLAALWALTCRKGRLLLREAEARCRFPESRRTIRGRCATGTASDCTSSHAQARSTSSSSTSLLGCRPTTSSTRRIKPRSQKAISGRSNRTMRRQGSGGRR